MKYTKSNIIHIPILVLFSINGYDLFNDIKNQYKKIKKSIMQYFNKFTIVLVSVFLLTSLSSFAQEYNKSILFEWKGLDNNYYNELKANSTFKYYSPNNIIPILKDDEMGAFTRRSNGKINLDLLIQGNKNVIRHHQKNGYNEFILPESIRINPSNYEGVTKLLNINSSSYGKYWDVFKIDMDLNDSPESYQVPLQLRFNMKPNSTNKVEISLRNNGQITFSADNKSKVDKALVFYAGDKIDIKNRFLLEFRFSNEGDFIVFVNNKKHFSRQIPKHFFLDGSSNRVWFEGETSIYLMSLEHWTNANITPIGLTENLVYDHNRAVTKHFENLMKKHSIKNQKIVTTQNSSDSDPWGLLDSPGSFEPDIILPKTMDVKKGTFTLKSYKQLAIRSTYNRNSYTMENGQKKQYMSYKIHLLVSGTYRTLRNSTEEVTFPLSYSIFYPRDFKDSQYYLYIKEKNEPVRITRSRIDF